MVEEAGKDATEAFEDVGHSDEARAQLVPLYIGDFSGEVSNTSMHTSMSMRYQCGEQRGPAG